jgi:uncharacterized surface protein with fasciclin (FAS1) repeats
MAHSTPTCDVVAALTSTARFRTLVTILVATQVLDDLRATGPWLVLAPPDDAFARWPRLRLESLFARSNIEPLVDLAELHVARTGPGGEAGLLQSLRGEPLHIAPDGQVNEGQARVLGRLRCTNGVIGVVDRVLLPRCSPWSTTPASQASPDPLSGALVR